MNLEDLGKFGIEKFYIEKFKEEKISKLYPPQVEIIKKGLFKENFVLSLPTAGGKTFIATLSMINKLQKSRCKIIYIVPLVSLANEKYKYYQNFFKGKYKVAISVGDYDSADPWLSRYDIIIVTSEKLDSLLRHNIDWIREVCLVVVDEIHLLTDPSRGPTLEVLITKLKKIIPKAQFVCLSATIKNVREIADWLDAKYFVSDFRPVKLYEGVAFDSKIYFLNKKGYELKGELEEGITQNLLDLKKQGLFFVSTRRGAESLAEKLSKLVSSRLLRQEKRELQKLSDDILNVLEIPTRQCKRLAKCVKNGVAFHHAGLLRKQKLLIEDNFRKGIIKIIVATPTLALGINLPAFRVIVRDAKRYYRGFGAAYIPVLEYKQFCGRAGRPQYDSFGESVLCAKTEEEAQELVDRFIMGEPEAITSKLAMEPVLRMHILALISTKFCLSEKSLYDFFSKTFYAYHYGDMRIVNDKISELLELLIKWNFVKRRGKRILPTRIGSRISELYIDPLTAHHFIESIKISKKRKINEFSILQLISNTIEMHPLLSVRVGEFADLEDLLAREEEYILQKIPEEWELEFDDFFRSLKTAMLFYDWINELTEDQLLAKYHVAPGELRGRLEIADWLIYSLSELTRLISYKKILPKIRKLRVRLQYGVKEELLPLVRLKQIGRVRARKLFDVGLTSLSKLRKIPLESLSRVIGPKIAYDIKIQLGQITKKLEEKQTTLK